MAIDPVRMSGSVALTLKQHEPIVCETAKCADESCGAANCGEFAPELRTRRTYLSAARAQAPCGMSISCARMETVKAMTA